MTPQDFTTWRKGMGWTKVRTADELGLSRDTIADIETGKAPIRRSIALACTALALRLPPWPVAGLTASR